MIVTESFQVCFLCSLCVCSTVAAVVAQDVGVDGAFAGYFSNRMQI